MMQNYGHSILQNKRKISNIAHEKGVKNRRPESICDE